MINDLTRSELVYLIAFGVVAANTVCFFAFAAYRYFHRNGQLAKGLGIVAVLLTLSLAYLIDFANRSPEIREGTVIHNPETGERRVLRGGEWQVVN